MLLSQEMVILDEDTFRSPSFQMITDILGSDQIEKYAQNCPEIFDQQRNLFGILDDFQWGEDYRETFQALAEYFKTHLENLYNEMVSVVLSPAQMKHKQLLQQYLNYSS